MRCIPLDTTCHAALRQDEDVASRHPFSSAMASSHLPLPSSPPSRIDETIATGRPRERGCPPIAPSLLYFPHPFPSLLRSRRRRGCYEAMMKGEMDYSRESAANDITFLRDGFHFLLYPMALSHSRVCFDKLETPICPLLGLNFIGVLSPQVSPASRRRVAHGGFVARGLRLAWHSAERSPQKSPSSSVSEGGNCLWRKTCCLPWDLSTIRL